MSRTHPVSALQAAMLLALLGSIAPLSAAEFAYEGHLDDRGVPASGRYDIRLVLYRDAEYGAALAAPLEFRSVDVVDGRFRLQFEAPLEGTKPAWVELAVRDAGAKTYSVIPVRTKAILAPATIGACWSSTGDSGSNPAVNFLGTTDAQPLVLRTGNAQSLRIEPSAELFNGNPITANVIGGSSANSVDAGVRGATISGGGVVLGGDPSNGAYEPNRVTDHYGTIGGGIQNQAGDGAGSALDRTFATVGGGYYNRARGTASTITGGYANIAEGLFATVGGGAVNKAGNQAVVAGGSLDNALGYSSAVLGGEGNTATGQYATVAGGSTNCAGGDRSWAGGRRAKVRPGVAPGLGTSCDSLPSYPGGSGDAGSFVWADSQNADFSSTGSNQFLVRAAGGIGLNTNDPKDPGTAEIASLVVQGLSTVPGTVMLRSPKGSNASFVHYGASGDWYIRSAVDYGAVVIQDQGGRVGIGTTEVEFGHQIDTGAFGAYLSSDGFWTDASSRWFKQDFADVDTGDILAKVLALPLTTWRYRTSTGHRHLGPMAEDFADAFGVGDDAQHLAPLDADGVALAAIQGLNARLETDNARLEQSDRELRAELASLKARLAALEREPPR